MQSPLIALFSRFKPTVWGSFFLKDKKKHHNTQNFREMGQFLSVWRYNFGRFFSISGLKSHYHRTPPQKESVFSSSMFFLKSFLSRGQVQKLYRNIFSLGSLWELFVFCTIRQPYCIVTVGLKFVKICNNLLCNILWN